MLIIGQARKPEPSAVRPDARAPIVGVKPTDWRRTSQKPGKNTYMRYDPGTDLVEIVTEWFNEVPLIQARQERELYELGAGPVDMKPTAVIPQAVVAQSLREGWYHDDAKWKRWMNDGDNSNLRITRGRV